VGGWVARQRLDRLTAPNQADPRKAIREELNKKEVRKQFAGLGAELIWINIGHIDTPPEVDKQRLEAWQAIWQRDEMVTEAYGAALEVAYAELGRAEGQATMLSTIAHALEPAMAEGQLSRQQMADLILLRIGHVLDTLNTSPVRQIGPGKNGKHPPDSEAAA
jgi:hypothetical protein